MSHPTNHDRKLTYEELSAGLSDLYFRSLELKNWLSHRAHDHVEIQDSFHWYSPSASDRAYTWFERRREKKIVLAGWTPEEYAQADKEWEEAYFADLEQKAAEYENLPPLQVIHDPEPEPDW